MSYFIHSLCSCLNPTFNIIYEKLQQRDLHTYSYIDSSGSVGSLLKKQNITNILIVTDSFLSHSELITPLINSLKENDINYFLFDKITPDPNSDLVIEGSKTLINQGCQGIISFGGGSSIDSAKVIAGLSLNINKKKYIGLNHINYFSRRRGVLPIIAIPTTAGTGAEVTMGSVISNSKTHKKGICYDTQFAAKNVFLDGRITTGLPPHITSSTGFDALTHCIEGFISKIASPVSRDHSIKGIHAIFTNLTTAYHEPDNLEARQKMLEAANHGGFALGRSHIGVIHAIGHNAGAIYNIPHGLIIALVLPHICELFIKDCEEQFATLGKLIQKAEQSDTNTKAARAFVDAIWDLFKEVKLPYTLDKIKPESFDLVANRAIKEGYLYPSPRYVSKKEIISILEKIAE